MTACLHCGAAGWKPLWEKPGYTISRCTTCDLIATDPIPAPEQAEALFSEDYFHGEDDTQGYLDYAGDRPLLEANFRRRLRWLLQVMDRDRGDWLDYGCALGFTLPMIRDAGFTAWGIDRARYAAEYAREQLGMEHVTASDSLGGAFPGRTFDVIAFMDMLEVTPDPPALIAEAVSLLNPGGFIVLDAWNPDSAMARWCGSNWHAISPPNRLYYFSHPFLERMFAAHGMERAGIKRFGKRINLQTVAMKLHLPGLKKRKALKRIGVTVNLLDMNLVVYRKKPEA